jgi:MFS family permease
MAKRNPAKGIRDIYNEYSNQFWILILGTFIDRLGGALMFPFFTLYVTQKFNVGMTQVGILFGLFSLSNVIGGMLGGALTDRLGRKGMVIFGLVVSALTSVLMGLVNTIELFFFVTLVVGTFANIAGPAQQAMVADLVPEKKRAQGFGILRVVANLAVVIGPMIGGLLATRSYLLLFICDAISSLITAVIVAIALKETRPTSPEDAAQETMAQTFKGYLDVVKDGVFVLFLGASILMVIVYMQMNTTLAVYLRDNHGITERGFSYILSLNAAMVVLLQFPVTRWIGRYRPLLIMAVGTLLYAIGFAMYGFVSIYLLFLLAMVIITVGEMFVSPVGQAIVASLAPEDMRGRYMAVYGFSWILPAAVGPLLAGLVIDNLDPNWVWYGSGIIGAVAVAAFALLDRKVERSTWTAVDARLNIMEMLEEGKITAEEAAKLLKQIEEQDTLTFRDCDPAQERRYLRVRISDLGSGTVKADMALPMGLVNTVLSTGGQVCDDLDDLDHRELQTLIERTTANQSVESIERDDDTQVEISVE